MTRTKISLIKSKSYSHKYKKDNHKNSSQNGKPTQQ